MGCDYNADGGGKRLTKALDDADATIAAARAARRAAGLDVPADDEADALIAAAKGDDVRPIAGKRVDIDPKPGGFHLIPRRALTALAGQYEHGAEVYGRYNWELGRPFSDYVDALERHLGAWLEGEELDEEGKPNLIAVAWLAFALYEFQLHHPELDDRRPR